MDRPNSRPFAEKCCKRLWISLTSLIRAGRIRIFVKLDALLRLQSIVQFFIAKPQVCVPCPKGPGVHFYFLLNYSKFSQRTPLPFFGQEGKLFVYNISLIAWFEVRGPDIRKVRRMRCVFFVLWAGRISRGSLSRRGWSVLVRSPGVLVLQPEQRERGRGIQLSCQPTSRGKTSREKDRR